MKTISSLLLASVSALVFLNGCTGKQGDPGPAGPAGPAGPNLSGNLIGFVNPIGEDGVELSKSGVTVTVTSVTPQLTQTTDANGRYEFASLKGGTYNLSFSRSGLGTYKVFGFSHVGGDAPTVIANTYVPAISQTFIANLVNRGNFTSNTGSYTELTGLFINNSVSSPYRAAVVYAGTSAGVSAATGTPLGTFYAYQSSSNSTAYIDIARNRFTGAGFNSGTTVYLVAYGVPEAYNPGYNDPSTGRVVYAGMNPTPSTVVSATVPY